MKFQFGFCYGHIFFEIVNNEGVSFFAGHTIPQPLKGSKEGQDKK